MTDEDKFEKKLEELEEVLKGPDGTISDENLKILNEIRHDVKVIKGSKERIRMLRDRLENGGGTED
jgi:hypothetical protein